MLWAPPWCLPFHSIRPTRQQSHPASVLMVTHTLPFWSQRILFLSPSMSLRSIPNLGRPLHPLFRRLLRITFRKITPMNTTTKASMPRPFHYNPIRNRGKSPFSTLLLINHHLLEHTTSRSATNTRDPHFCQVMHHRHLPLKLFTLKTPWMKSFLPSTRRHRQRLRGYAMRWPPYLLLLHPNSVAGAIGPSLMLRALLRLILLLMISTITQMVSLYRSSLSLLWGCLSWHIFSSDSVA